MCTPQVPNVSADSGCNLLQESCVVRKTSDLSKTIELGLNHSLPRLVCASIHHYIRISILFIPHQQYLPVCRRHSGCSHVHTWCETGKKGTQGARGDHVCVLPYGAAAFCNLQDRAFSTDTPVLLLLFAQGCSLIHAV